MTDELTGESKRPRRKWPRKLRLVDLELKPITTTRVRSKCLFDTMPVRKTPDGRPMLDAQGQYQRMTCAYRSGQGRKAGCRRKRSNAIVLNERGDCPLRKPMFIVLTPVKEDHERP